MTILNYLGLIWKVKVASFSLIEGFLLSENSGVWFPHLNMIWKVKVESLNLRKGHDVDQIIGIHSWFDCQRMNYSLNNTFVLTALDMGKERGAKQLVVCQKIDGEVEIKGTRGKKKRFFWK